MALGTIILLVAICFCQPGEIVGYVEAVGASVDVSASEPDMRVATFCDKSGAVYHNQYVDGAGRWVSGLDERKGCLKTEQEILDFCMLIYPGYSFARVVQSTHSYMISDWCKVGHKKCKESFWVKPYKCVLADIHSSDLVVPESCKLDHIQNEASCRASHAWSMIANQSCRDSGMQLDSYASHFPCGNDKFTKIEFVCCPKKGKKSKVQGKVHSSSSMPSNFDYVNEDIMPLPELSVKESTRDPYFTKFDPRIEHDAFRAAEQRLEMSNRRKITKVMKEWTDLEERYQKIKSKNPKKAEKFKLKMTERFNRMMNALKDQGLSEKHQLIDLHQQRIIAHITERKKDGMKCLVKALNERPPTSAVVRKCLNHLLRALFKDRHHTISHFSHMAITNADNAQSQVKATVSHLRDIERMVNESLQMLDRYPDIQSEVRPDMGHLIDELQRRDIIPPQLEAAYHAPEEEEPIPEPEVWTYDADSNRIDIDVEVERHSVALGDQHVEPAPAHVETHRHVHAEATFQLRETSVSSDSGRGAYMTLALLSLALTVALVAGVMIRRRRRTPRRAGFIEVDQTVTPEEKHVAQMQVNGYENPTYRYFESK